MFNVDPTLYKFDKTDIENHKKVDTLLTEFDKMEEGIEQIGSQWLMQPEDLSLDHGVDCDHELTKCEPLKRITKTLMIYHEYMAQKQQEQKHSDEQDDHIYFDGYNNTKLLNDYNHLLYAHPNTDFEDIYNILVREANNGSICSLSKCVMMRRNNRNRTYSSGNDSKMAELYLCNDDDDIVKQQMLDRVHSYYFHSFDIGYKFTKTDKQNIFNEQNKDEIVEEKKNDDSIYDENVIKINKYIKNRQNNYKDIDSLLTRIKYNKNNKFNCLSIDKMNQNLNQYSFGYRYFYWKYYKNNDEKTDQASQMQSYSQQECNDNATVGDWYIEPKYSNLKEEMISNEICAVSKREWIHLMQKALSHHQTHFVQSYVIGLFNSKAHYYDMQHAYDDGIPKQTMYINHLIAVMIYCNYDQLSFRFSATYRRLDQNEPLQSMKKRHRNYYWMGRLLRECTECFGMRRSLERNVQTFDFTTSLNKYCQIYHGVAKQYVFSSIFAFIKGPLSTTTDYNVAVNFCNNQGMILGMRMYDNEWSLGSNFSFDFSGIENGKGLIARVNCFDCSWISDFTNEQEIFCIGGMRQFRLSTIIVAPNGINYSDYIKGLLEMIHSMMSNGDSWIMLRGSKKQQEKEYPKYKQLAFRLLSHELFRYFPSHKYAFEFKTCPNYVKALLHKTCLNIKKFVIDHFTQQNVFGWNLFRYDRGWIKLYLIMTLFPNMKYIYYGALSANLEWLQQSAIYDSILCFLQTNRTSKVRIQIDFHPKYKQEMKAFIEQYKKKFHKYGSDIGVSEDMKTLTLRFIHTDSDTRAIIMISCNHLLQYERTITISKQEKRNNDTKDIKL